MSKSHRNSLTVGYRLHWYEIREILGQGGFGITYLAMDTNLNKEVAIKEYLPIEMAVREGNFSVHPVTENHQQQYEWGLDRFLKEARTLAKFDHPNIVRVHAVFEENNTGYMVMNYEKGDSLAEKLKGRQTMEEGDLMRFLFPILGGLEQMHASGFIHRDIKPDNIFIRKDGSPVLLDFGSARQALGGETRTLTSLVTPGYAPFEQYYAKSDEQGPWTDIYGLGATLYRAVSGIAPMDAVDRSNSLLKRKNDTYISIMELGKAQYTERFLLAIDNALQFNTEDRPQSVAEWREQFGLPKAPLKGANIDSVPTQPGTQFEAILNTPRKETTQRSQRTKSNNGLMKWLAISLSIVLITALAYYFQPDIEQQLANWKSGQEVELLIETAHIDMQSDRLIKPIGNNALEKYQLVLSKDPGHHDARLGLNTIAEQLLKQLEINLINGELASAEAILKDMQKSLPENNSTLLALREVKRARAKQEQLIAEEETRKAELYSTLIEANEKAVTGNATEVLLLVVKAQSLGAEEKSIQLIQKRLWLSIDSKINELEISRVANATGAEEQRISAQIKQLQKQISSLPVPSLTDEDEKIKAARIAEFSAQQGLFDQTMEWLLRANQYGLKADRQVEIKQSLKSSLTRMIEQALLASKQATENKDIEVARSQLQKAKAIKLQIDQINEL